MGKKSHARQKKRNDNKQLQNVENRIMGHLLFLKESFK
jgi:hypothetical protein